jgi:hypothetical protein
MTLPGWDFSEFLWFNFGLGGNIGIFEVSFIYDRSKELERAVIGHW